MSLNKKGFDISHLSEQQHTVTQESGTERAYSEGNFHDNKAPGIYVDIVSGEPLYSSTHKFNSQTGWPSFTQALKESAVTYHDDWVLVNKRTEVRSSKADSHLGHVFENEPLSPNGIRHCINGAALRFVPKEQMAAEGYQEWLYLFED